MKCFNHHDFDAVALCNWCNHGLCPGCAVEVDDRLACRDRCEAAVERLNHVGQASFLMVEQTERSRGVTRLAQISLVAFVMVTGVLISVLGYTRWSDSRMILPLGVFLVGFGLILGVVMARYSGKPEGLA